MISRAAVLWLVVAVTIGLSAGARCEAQTKAGATPDQALPIIRFCMSPAMFPQVNVRDAELAMELWTTHLKESMAVPAELELSIIEDLETIEAAVAAGELDILALTVQSYLDMRSRLPVRADVVPQRGGKVLTPQVLLVRKDGDIANVGQLPGHRVLVSTLDRGQTARMWLDVLLMREGLGPASEDSLVFDLRDRPGHAVPPVLFGQADACIVDSVAYELLCELNPQLRRDLRVLATSPGLLTRVMCSRQDMDPVLRAMMIDNAMIMHTQPEGEQILALLQTERPVLFREEHLKAVLELMAEHERLHRAWVLSRSRP